MAYLKISDPVFDQQVTLRQAYDILYRFLVAYHGRGESSTVALLTDVGIAGNGTSGDPSQIYDFVRLAEQVLNEGPHRTTSPG
jgi:hypothetical protein